MIQQFTENNWQNIKHMNGFEMVVFTIKEAHINTLLILINSYEIN